MIKAQKQQYYLKKQLARWREHGSIWFIRRLFFLILRLIVKLLLLPLALVAYLLGLRRVNVAGQYIGHLASEPDCLLKLIHLNLLPKKRYFITASSKTTSNRCLLEYWRNHITIITNPILRFLLSTISSHRFTKLDTTSFVTTETTSARYYEVNSLWGKRPPLLSLSHLHRTQGYEVLHRLGLPKDAWYVCLHVRESGYVRETDHIHAYRNADINNYHAAINTIASHGGWVIRMGDQTMKKLNGIPNFIDYAHSAEKSEWMDVFLCAESKLFLGNTSGLFLTSTAFGIPCALVNMTPLAAQAFGSNDIYIPKLLRDKKSGRYLKFSEVLQSPAANFRDSILFINAGLELEENSPEDINDLVQEALLRIKKQWSSSPEDEERQMNFKRLFREGHYGYKGQSRLGSSFIAKYEHLI